MVACTYNHRGELKFNLKNFLIFAAFFATSSGIVVIGCVKMKWIKVAHSDFALEVIQQVSNALFTLAYCIVAPARIMSFLRLCRYSQLSALKTSLKNESEHQHQHQDITTELDMMEEEQRMLAQKLTSTFRPLHICKNIMPNYFPECALLSIHQWYFLVALLNLSWLTYMPVTIAFILWSGVQNAEYDARMIAITIFGPINFGVSLIGESLFDMLAGRVNKQLKNLLSVYALEEAGSNPQKAGQDVNALLDEKKRDEANGIVSGSYYHSSSDAAAGGSSRRVSRFDSFSPTERTTFALPRPISRYV